MHAKIDNVRGNGYIIPDQVESLTYYFSVPKRDDDIRLVYDATRTGLNSTLWAPNFQLPTVDALVRVVESGSWMGDLDVGEMFLNFCLDPCLRPFCGVDVTLFYGASSPLHM